METLDKDLSFRQQHPFEEMQRQNWSLKDEESEQLKSPQGELEE
jgi:hypothetical protein